MPDSPFGASPLSFAVGRELPPGPWSSEPDKDEWVTEVGLRAFAKRNLSGVWCGYVEVVEAGLPVPFTADEEIYIVHGGITYGGKLIDADGKEVNVVGFDCNHLGDMAPNDTYSEHHAGIKEPTTYRTLDFAKAECETLADQVFVWSRPEIWRAELAALVLAGGDVVLLIERLASAERHTKSCRSCRRNDGIGRAVVGYAKRQCDACLRRLQRNFAGDKR